MFPKFSLLIRSTYRSFFTSKDSVARLTLRRLVKLINFLLFYFTLAIPGFIGYLADDIFFGKYRQHPVKEPFFITGNFRSGSTLLQRIMSRDTHNFIPINTWEIYLAPSITQRKIFKFMMKVDLYLGKGLHRFVNEIEKRTISTIKMHEVGLRKPEEDEGFNVFTISSMFLWVPFPFMEEFENYLSFDTKVKSEDRERAMGYYKTCIQRHLYMNQSQKRFLSKNPAFSTKINSLYQQFPDAKIIYLARDPIELVPSLVSFFAYIFNIFHDPKEKYPMRDYMFSLCKNWYHYSLDALARHAPEKYMVVKYDDLVLDPETIIRDIYAHFQLTLTPEFNEILHEEAILAHSFKGASPGVLEKQGFTKEQVVTEFRDLIDRFGFASGKN
jgi:omega-hydroxy-beta-dihydromenaquinone-9 sulfotransferase